MALCLPDQDQSSPGLALPPRRSGRSLFFLSYPCAGRCDKIGLWFALRPRRKKFSKDCRCLDGNITSRLPMEKEDGGLRGFILSQIERRGAVPFSQFMEWCLYHPRYGYYQTRGVKIGAGGDYYSSPTVHPIFGSLVARQILQMSEFLEGERFDVIEMGGGRGFLSEDILNWAEKTDPAFYDRLHYHLVEGAPFFLGEEKERLVRHEKRGKSFGSIRKPSRRESTRSKGASSPMNWWMPSLFIGSSWITGM